MSQNLVFWTLELAIYAAFWLFNGDRMVIECK